MVRYVSRKAQRRVSCESAARSLIIIALSGASRALGASSVSTVGKFRHDSTSDS